MASKARSVVSAALRSGGAAADLSNGMPAPPRRRAVVVSGPSGGGKSTVVNLLFERNPHRFGFSVSHSTRQPRPGEQDGREYHFVERSTMDKLIARGEFLEHAVFGGNLYGTSKRAVESVQEAGHICILDVDLQGVRAIKRSGLPAIFVFFRPPSLKVLESRLRQRQTDTEEAIQKRLKHAVEDTQAVDAEEGLFDYDIVNDQLESAYQEFHNAIRAEMDL